MAVLAAELAHSRGTSLMLKAGMAPMPCQGSAHLLLVRLLVRCTAAASHAGLAGPPLTQGPSRSRMPMVLGCCAVKDAAQQAKQQQSECGSLVGAGCLGQAVAGRAGDP